MAEFSRDLDRANEAFRSGDLVLAARLLKRILAAQPLHSGANELMAYVEANRGNLERAFACLRTATQAPGASATSWYYLGVALFRQGRVDEAEAAFRSALKLRADFFEALHDLGRALHEKGRHAEAVESFERAAAVKPASFEVFHNAGRSLQAAGRHREALEHYDSALRIKPDSPETWCNRGESLHDLKRMDEALESYSKAQALRPDYHEALANEALVRLASGDWQAGWKAFEARWKGAQALSKRHEDLPAWSGESPLEGKRILAWCEQGFGDTLQFCRFVPRLLERGAEVVLEVQPALQPLLEANFRCRVIAEGDEIPRCDLQIPLLSLPLAFAVTPENVPANVPYLHAAAERVERWRARVARPTSMPKVAIACSGRKTHKHESRRRVSLRDFASLASLCHLYLVQKDLSDDDRAVLGAEAIAVDFLGDEIADFRDGAAILANMDLVISIDTSLVHLAGAMGKPVWVLLADVPDWRWMLQGRHTPWYPTATLFRQKEPGDWAGVLAEVRHALENLSAPRTRSG